MIVLIQNTNSKTPAATTGWLEAIERLGRPLAWQDELNGYPVANDWNAVNKFAEKHDESTVLCVDARQVYLDAAIVADGVEQAGSGWDYFTQFEHCRLPVGVGCRAFSLQNEEIRSWSQGPDELTAHILANPLRFVCRYDERPLTDFVTSLADSRFQAGHPFFEEMPTAPSLENFTSRAVKIAPPNYEASTESAFVDERLMPAGFGFESRECADFPTYVMFDVTNVCNAKCVHCPHSTVFPEKRGAKRHLPLDYFKQVVDECTDKPLNFVRITADGEPLLHPDIIEMLNYCGAKGVGPVGLTTNGSLMNEETAQKVIDSGIFMADFSLDAATEETYNNIRVGLSFKKTYENVNRFLELAREQRPEMKVMVSYVKQEGNLHEVDTFREYWEPKVDKVLVRELISNVNLVDTPRADAEIQRRWPCPHFFRRIVINYDGVLKACPIDWENKTSYRSLGETSIFDAWHSEYYHRARMEHLNLAFKTVTACGDCADWAGSPWELGYEKVVNTL